MKKVHITILGSQALPIYYPIALDRPDEVFLLGTNENILVAAQLESVIKSKDWGKNVIVHRPPTVNAYDVATSENACREILESVKGCEITCSIVGGTKTMCIGVYKAAKEAIGKGECVKIIYTDSKNILDVESGELTPIELQIDNNTISALQGQSLKKCIEYIYDEERLSCAKEVKDYICRHKKDYEVLRKAYDKCGKEQKLYKYPLNYNPHGLSYSYDERQENISIENESYATDFGCEDVYKLFFEGRWWEEIVANKIWEWTKSKGKGKVYVNVEYQYSPSRDAKTNTKNEIDILVNVGTTFLFIECKSGTVTQDNINKTGGIRKLYGSDKSKSILISYYPINPPDLKRKAEEQGVHVIEGGSLKGLFQKLDKILNSINA